MTVALPVITLATLTALGLLAVALGSQVIIRRVLLRVEAGDGGLPQMAQAVRAHANFSEHVPMALLLLGAVEMLGYGNSVVGGLGMALVLARLASAIGLSRSLGPSFARQAGASVTLLVMLASSALTARALLT